MCGIAGYVGTETGVLPRMLSAISHRGPDAQVVYHRGPVHFSHARLSIIDTSLSANQPMESGDGTAVITFNGEIYNFQALRADLEKRGRRFRTHSDTEVILELYREHGTDAFALLEGMFALALYDFTEKRLIVARDRVGEKPLYLFQTGDTVYFASELRALIESGVVPKRIDQLALSQYLACDYVPAPRTILEGVEKVMPATYVIFENGTRTEHQYWSPPQTTELSFADARAALDRTLEATMRDVLVSDVPLGVFLSGGLDSATVAYYAAHERARAGQKIDTFAIGFSEASFDESPYARRVAAHLGTTHHERIVTAHDARAVIEKLPLMLSEPLADPSCIPTYLLACFARETVTVALGGDGGDELFAGYQTFQAEALHTVLSTLPQWVTRAGSALAEALPHSHGYLSSSYLIKKFFSSTETDPAVRHALWLGTFLPERVRGLLLSQHDYSGTLYGHVTRAYQDAVSLDPGTRILFSYLRSYLSDQVLAKVDRASMQPALEVRAPLLHRPVLDLALSLPYKYKYRRGTTKYVLKSLMRERLPSGIADRKKHGFGLPIAEWVKGPLKPLMTDLLSEASLRSQGIFNPVSVRSLVEGHLRGQANNRKELWNLMVFQLWYNRWMRS